MNVIIVGGGFCGSIVAKKLEKNINLQVTLIDKKKYFEYSPSLAKILFDPLYNKKIIVPFSSFLKNTKLVNDSLVNVKQNCVETTNETFHYNYLVLCPGIDYPIYLSNKKQVITLKSDINFNEINSDLRHAKRVLIVGGGVIGTELAGEFATRTPEKKITIIHSHNRLLERNKFYVSSYAQKFLEERGINIIFGEKVVEHKNGIFITDKDKVVEADLGFWCTGIMYNPFFMKGFEKSIFTKQNALIVNQYLQLKEHPNIFVGGDLTGIEEEKTAAHADCHASVIAENINRIVRKKSLISYKSRVEPMDISLGCWDGILTYPPFVLVGFIPGVTKQIVEKIALLRL